MSFRVEEKIAVTRMQLELSFASLLDAGATELYPERRINSCYFDTINTKSFFDSEEGLLPRKKVRIRHYGNSAESCQDYFLETKISSFEGRYKTVEKISTDVANAKLAHGIFDRSLGLISPVLTVSYRRRYLYFLGNRITIDTDISYQRPDLDLNLSEKLSVIEIKSFSTEACLGVVPILSAQRVRFSKYCRGLLRFGERQYGRKRAL